MSSPSKHAERLAGGKTKIGKGSDLEPCISLFATQQKILAAKTNGSSPSLGIYAKLWLKTCSWPRCCAFRAAFKWGECFQAQKKLLVSFFFWLVAAWVKSRAERPSVSGVNRQLHVQIGCKLGIRNRKDELTKQAKRNELQINPKVIKGVNACRKRTRSS